MQKKNSHTSTLFHYTNKQSVILSILKEGIKFGFCKEILSDKHCVGIPMISFCDIPIGNSAEHSHKYGRYAIGLSKEYILNNYSEGIGPVNYYTSEHFIDAAFKLLEEEKAYRDVLEKMSEGKKKDSSMTINGMYYEGFPLSKSEIPFALNAFLKSDNYHRAATRAIGLMKRYQSEYKGKMQVNYDECEWRMVIPEYADIAENKKCRWFWTEEEYDRWRKTSPNKFLDNMTLSFTPSDINYLIVPTNKQIPSIIKALSHLKEVCGNPISTEERSQLYSRVISFEQIKSDF
ncbi:MAG: hypothetical protein J6T43_12610 [Prevotella sp.]|nr:hypothetical protein [Prevotella sp.]